jgi:excinuclease ABC subunit C
VEDPDDYASMREVVFRRYKRIMNEEEKLPNLIVADGGIGQMEIIRQVVEDELKLNIPIAGLAKDSKHKTREILFGFPPMVIGLDPSDQLFKFFANMQDEVHRFAIKFHREKRSKSQIKSELDIKGIGPKTKEMLLKKFKSVKRIKELTIEEMADEIGISKANIVYKHFNNEI